MSELDLLPRNLFFPVRLDDGSKIIRLDVGDVALYVAGLRDIMEAEQLAEISKGYIKEKIDVSYPKHKIIAFEELVKEDQITLSCVVGSYLPLGFYARIRPLKEDETEAQFWELELEGFPVAELREVQQRLIDSQ